MKSSRRSVINVGGRAIGEAYPPLVIAEVGQNHDGSLGLAHSYVDAVADAGCDAVKFQTHIAVAESSVEDQFRVPFSWQDGSRFDYWKRMEFTEEQWHGLARHAQERGLIFLSSPFSVQAVELLHRIGVPAWKIGSGELCSEDLLAAVQATGSPILLSTGMSSWREITVGANSLSACGYPFGIFQCTSVYPTPHSQVGLNVVTQMRERFDCPIGLSDHSGEIFASLAAMVLGASMVEVHVTFDKRMFGPDMSSSLSLDDVALLIRGRDAVFQMRECEVDKDAMAVELSDMKRLFEKSLSPKRPLKAGDILTEEVLTSRKPGTGIPVADRGKVIGRRLIRDVDVSQLLTMDDLEAPNA